MMTAEEKGESTWNEDAYQRAKYRLEVALEARRFEIDLLWQRSLFFWGFTTAAFGAVAWSFGTHPRLSLILSVVGLVLSLLWCFANRGSRFWHVRWENKVAALEGAVIGKMFREIPKQSSERWWSGKRYSVSRLAIALSDYLAGVWFLLVSFQLASRFGWSPSDSVLDSAIIAFILGSGLWIWFVKVQTSTHDED